MDRLTTNDPPIDWPPPRNSASPGISISVTFWILNRFAFCPKLIPLNAFGAWLGRAVTVPLPVLVELIAAPPDVAARLKVWGEPAAPADTTKYVVPFVNPAGGVPPDSCTCVPLV